MRNPIILCASIMMLLTSCKKEESQDKLQDEMTAGRYDRISEMDWLLGQWEQRTETTYNSEIWQKENDSVYKGYSFVVMEGDTVSKETVELVQKGEALLYVPTVENQNNAQPITFTLTSAMDGKFIFENKNHDFPTRISYIRLSENELLAAISGKQNGKTRVIEFPMKRVN